MEATDNNHQSAIVKLPHEGKVVSVAGDNYRLLLGNKESGGGLGFIHMTIPPGGGPAPHSHPSMHEVFYVLEGQLQYTTEEGRLTATPGTVVYIPTNGPVHQFRNVSDEVAVVLCFVVPGGLEEMFEQMGQATTEGTFLPRKIPGAEDMARLAPLAQKYDQHPYPEDYLTTLLAQKGKLQA